MRASPRKGKVARWFSVGEMPSARYLSEIHEGSVVWDARIEEALVFSWPYAIALAHRLRGMALTCEDDDTLVCALPPQEVFADLERRQLA